MQLSCQKSDACKACAMKITANNITSVRPIPVSGDTSGYRYRPILPSYSHAIPIPVNSSVSGLEVCSGVGDAGTPRAPWGLRGDGTGDFTPAPAPPPRRCIRARPAPPTFTPATAPPPWLQTPPPPRQCSWCPHRLLPSLDRHFSNALQVLHLTNGTFKPSTLTKENDFQTLLFPSSFIAKVNRSLCFQ